MKLSTKCSFRGKGDTLRCELALLPDILLVPTETMNQKRICLDH
jgi:hypothetical protein